MESAGMAMMWFQQADTISSGDSKLLVIFIGIVALGSLTQMAVLIAMAIGAAKARKEVLSIMHEVHGKAMPLMASAQEIVKDLTPKVKAISENLVETTNMVKGKALELDVMLTRVNATVADANQKTHAQVNRVDGMVTSALNATSDLAAAVHHGIRTPVREVVGVVNGFKAGLEVLLGKGKTFGSYGRERGRDGVLRNNDVEY